jgi:YesN/AraC family two-component response regulator
LLFNELLAYYEKLNIPEKQIDYLNKLIYVDSIAKVYYKYFDADMKQKIETPDLLKAKERLILRLQENNSRFVKANIFIGAILVICVVSLLYFVYKKKIYKDRFEALLNTVESSIPNHKNTYNTYEISSDVVQTVIDKLNDFEARELFLSCNISLLTLAKSFETNANYLSRVINLKIGKNFSQYINDLRIDYATKNILNNPKLRKYTIKAIAEECGYRNAESFSKAFYKRHKIYPSFYIKELNKQKSKG